jgi:hypothetical protein
MNLYLALVTQISFCIYQQTWGNNEIMSFAVDPSSDKAVIASSIKGQCLAKRKTNPIAN